MNKRKGNMTPIESAQIVRLALVLIKYAAVERGVQGLLNREWPPLALVDAKLSCRASRSLVYSSYQATSLRSE